MKVLIVTIRLTLDPDVVQNAEENGASKQDIIREIKEHITSAVGNQAIPDGGYILDTEILDIDEED